MTAPAFPIFTTLKSERVGRVLTLTLNRPEALNAVDETMHGELAAVFDAASDDPHSDVIILTGSGRAFCAGGDIGWMQKMIDHGFSQTAREARRIVMSLLDCEKPVIAKVNGPAVGLGATIALLCDVIFAADTARIGDPHVTVGLTAGDGGALIWPQLIGFARARQYLLTGDMITAEEAARIGLINHCVPVAELDQRVEVFADRLANGARIAIRTTKRAINLPLKKLATELLDASLVMEELSSRQVEHQEAVNAFAQGRKPLFRKPAKE